MTTNGSGGRRIVAPFGARWAATFTASPCLAVGHAAVLLLCCVVVARWAIGAWLPGEGGQRLHVSVIVELAVRESRSGSARLECGAGTLSDAVTAEQGQRWACDAELVPIVLGAAGEPLDVGRTRRLANRAMRRALEQRDGGCAFRGCECRSRGPPRATCGNGPTAATPCWAISYSSAPTTTALSTRRVVDHHGERVSVSPPPPWIPAGRGVV
ncbi:MAG: DUF222 domain-containing protein [Actinobacteria bacterium]|nr:DUF222 domain-containing protein [Actinomycetota bacterium]